MRDELEAPRYCFDPSTLEPGRLLPGYRIVGARPETFTFGFRWSAADNMFTNAGLIAMEEWKKLNASVDEQSDERKLRQFVWALPTEDLSESTLSISASALRRRVGSSPRGVVPPDWSFSGFLDLGKRLCHWGVVAGLDRYQPVDTGVIEVPRELAEEDGIRVALWQWYDRVLEGWAEGRRPGIVGVDSGKWTTVVYEFIREVARLNSGVMWFATKGHGLSQDQGRVYLIPDKRTEAIPYIGDRYHIRLQPEHRIYLMHMDSDAWKGRVHAALTAPMGEPGSMVLWSAAPEDTDIWTLSKHLTAEKGVEEFDPKRGMVRRWVRTNRNNHLLDCVYGCLVGLDYLRVVRDAAEAARAAQGRAAASGTVAQPGSGVFRWTKEL